MKPLLLLSLLLISLSLYAQQAGNRENAGFWAAKGAGQMGAGQYAEAYSAFQLARSLGAPDMAAKMELAKKHNINSIQFRALLAEARVQAATDPTQSLRLLEYAHQKFPDSTVVLAIIGEVANQPYNWYYALRADSIQASPMCAYLLAHSDKSRLYYRRGDSLTLVYTFPERPRIHVFSPDEQYLFVATGETWRGSLITLHGPKIDTPRAFGEGVRSVRFSPTTHHGAWLLVNRYNRGAYLHDLQSADPTLGLVKLPDRDMHECLFSPGGQYLTTPKGLVVLEPHQVKFKKPVGSSSWTRYGDFSGYFSADDRHLLLVDAARPTGTSENGWLNMGMTLYTMTTVPGDTIRRLVTGLWAKELKPRPLWTPFSNDGRYLFINTAQQINGEIHYADSNGWHLVQRRRNAARKPAGTLAQIYSDYSNSVRFSSTNQLLTLEAQADGKRVARLWQLDGASQRLIHEFDQKTAVVEDIFSPDGRYLLAHHTNADCLWRIEPDTAILVHRFTKPVRQPNLFDERGWPVGSAWFSPKSGYLITYSGSTQDADSLWQIGPCGLTPVHGFGTRLKAGSTVFSSDERFLITEGSGTQPAMAWPIGAQIALFSDQLTSASEALFSPQGNVLLTHGTPTDRQKTPATLWQVTDRQLRPLRADLALTTVNNCQFSPNGQYLMASTVAQWRNAETTLYRVRPDQLDLLRRYSTSLPRYIILEGNVQYVTYQTGLFSPSGRQWLQANQEWAAPPGTMPNGVGFPPISRPDSLWQLDQATGATASQLTYGKATRVINRQVVNTAGNSIFKRWHVTPAALFSPDGSLLMTRERDDLLVYQTNPMNRVSTLHIRQLGWPFDVSATGSYWLMKSQQLYYTPPQTPAAPADTNAIDYDYRVDSPVGLDTVRLWRLTKTRPGPLNWKPVGEFSAFYKGLNNDWQGSRRQSLFSPTGSYLLLPTTQPALTTLYAMGGDTPRPVLSLKAQLLTAAHLPASPQNGWGAGLLYTTTAGQTYLLRHGSAGSRTTSLGFGLLLHPPHAWGTMAWWVRRKDESQQTVELLDLVSARTLVQVPFGSVLDMAVRPNGNAWVVSTTGARLVRSPGEVLYWLKQAPIAPLQAGLRQVFGFL